ncbi:MAG: hypothetical protein K2G88_09650 [Oscillospiraceae bacterium]|nr:hypothetical protein [Oscillospiraceae bacterium]
MVGDSVLYLFPYSLDLNPIEMMWSKIKALLCKWRADTVDLLYSLIPDAFSAVPLSDISGWFSACDYILS